MASTVYRAYKAPTNYSEADGAYLGLDGAVHAASSPGTAFLSDLSEWDIARTQASWLALTAPEISADLAATLVSMATQVGVGVEVEGDGGNVTVTSLEFFLSLGSTTSLAHSRAGPSPL